MRLICSLLTLVWIASASETVAHPGDPAANWPQYVFNGGGMGLLIYLWNRERRDREKRDEERQRELAAERLTERERYDAAIERLMQSLDRNTQAWAVAAHSMASRPCLLSLQEQQHVESPGSTEHRDRHTATHRGQQSGEGGKGSGPGWRVGSGIGERQRP